MPADAEATAMNGLRLDSTAVRSAVKPAGQPSAPALILEQTDQRPANVLLAGTCRASAHKLR